MDVSPAGGSDGLGDIIGVGYLHLPPPEHSRTVHYYQAHYGSVSGGGEASVVVGVQSVVITVPHGLARDANSGSGG